MQGRGGWTDWMRAASVEALERFAQHPERTHMPAWKVFYRRIAKAKGIGIFHETYRVDADAHESIYVNMPEFGLGAIRGVQSVAEEDIN